MNDVFCIEGDFIETHDNLIFDVKGILHPRYRIIAFVRYIPYYLFIEKMDDFLEYMISTVQDNSQYKIWKTQFADYKKKADNWIIKKSSDKMVEGLREIFDFDLGDIRYRNDKVPYIKIYDIKTRYDILSVIFPQYIYNHPNYDFPLQAVPKNDIKSIHKPDEKLRLFCESNADTEVDSASNSMSNSPNIGETLKKLADILTEGSGISSDRIGISGSVMVGLDASSGEKSDLDLIIYGKDEGKKIHDFLKELLPRDVEYPITRNGAKWEIYDCEKLKIHFKTRAKGFKVSFEKFCQYESRKLHQFLFDDIEVYIRFVQYQRDKNPLIGQFDNIEYNTMGRISFMGEITDITDSIFTPSEYRVRLAGIYNLTLKESLSKSNLMEVEEQIVKMGAILKIHTLRGRFTEQAKNKEKFYINGKLEYVRKKKSTNTNIEKNHFQVILGTDKDDAFYQI